MNLRKYFEFEEIDYIGLMSVLSGYSQPRKKIQSLLASGQLIRIKKGLYVFGSDFSYSQYSKEILANLIYGPSCISLEYALSYYGIIPERVETVTSITNKRNKSFDTQVGYFTYKYTHHKKFSIQMMQIPFDSNDANTC